MNLFKLIEHPPQPCGQLPRGSTAPVHAPQNELRAAL